MTITQFLADRHKAGDLAVTRARLEDIEFLFEWLRETFGNTLLEPQAGPNQDNFVILVWDTPAHHLEIEFCHKGFEWFYRDRVTSVCLSGTQRTPKAISSELQNIFLLFVVPIGNEYP